MFGRVTNMLSGRGGGGCLLGFLVVGEFIFAEFVIGFDSGVFETDDVVFLVFNFGKFVFGRGFEFTIKGVDYFFKTDNRLCVVSGIGFSRKR